jgi:hypothetical protein
MVDERITTGGYHQRLMEYNNNRLLISGTSDLQRSRIENKEFPMMECTAEPTIDGDEGSGRVAHRASRRRQLAEKRFLGGVPPM